MGGGLIGLEMAEALADMWGIETTIVEMADQIMPGFLSPALAKIAHRHLAERDVALYTSEMLRAIEGENGRAARVVTDRRTLKADLVILAVGVIPKLKVRILGGFKKCFRL